MKVIFDIENECILIHSEVVKYIKLRHGRFKLKFSYTPNGNFFLIVTNEKNAFELKKKTKNYFEIDDVIAVAQLRSITQVKTKKTFVFNPVKWAASPVYYQLIPVMVNYNYTTNLLKLVTFNNSEIMLRKSTIPDSKREALHRTKNAIQTQWNQQYCAKN